MAVTKEVKQGNDMLLQLAGTVYGAADSMSHEMTVETRETTVYKQGSGGEGMFKNSKVVAISWSANTDNALLDYDDYVTLHDLCKAGQPIAIAAVEATVAEDGSYTPKTSGLKISGNAIIESISINAQKDSDVMCSIKLKGTGASTAVNTKPA